MDIQMQIWLGPQILSTRSGSSVPLRPLASMDDEITAGRRTYPAGSAEWRWAMSETARFARSDIELILMRS
jgi:hypothetical protein